jgi:hypothetical protein
VPDADGHARGADGTRAEVVATRAPKQKLPTLGSWLLFIALGGLMGAIRYGGILSAEALPMLQVYGPFVIIAFHVLIILKAFRDNVFSGILCLLIPLYSFYYLFMNSDDFYLRAVVGGMLIGLGQDSAIYFNDLMIKVADIVQQWIQTGG